MRAAFRQRTVFVAVLPHGVTVRVDNDFGEDLKGHLILPPCVSLSKLCRPPSSGLSLHQSIHHTSGWTLPLVMSLEGGRHNFERGSHMMAWEWLIIPGGAIAAL